MTTAALTAIDIGADAIDFALRTGAATLDDMRKALSDIPWQPGNVARRLVLQESSNDPWSTAERRFHGLLRAAGIEGWRGNVEAAGTGYTVDVLFRSERLVIEIDGHAYHGDANFEHDRWRQNAIVLAGWRVLRFTWTMIDEYPERVIETVRAGLGQRRRDPTTTGSCIGGPLRVRCVEVGRRGLVRRVPQRRGLPGVDVPDVGTGQPRSGRPVSSTWSREPASPLNEYDHPARTPGRRAGPSGAGR